jgi:arginyl-tRNA synthetase
MLKLQGNTAPYMLYAYVRVQGISRQGQINFEELDQNFTLCHSRSIRNDFS